MAAEELRCLRSTLEALKKEGLVLETDREVNPKLEMTAIQKLMDGGPPIIFNNVKGYSNARLATNVMGSDKVIARMFGLKDRKTLKFKIHDSILQPIPPKIVDKAPCQEVVIDKNIDVWPVIPMIQHTPTDPGRTLGGGKTVASPKQFWGGCTSFNRMNFGGSRLEGSLHLQISPGSHTDQIMTKYYKKEPILTINMGFHQATMWRSRFMYYSPKGCDELGIAGAIQGFRWRW
jgi:4-hydroxy-3-polyprenylbenzoate decarboxylase